MMLTGATKVARYDLKIAQNTATDPSSPTAMPNAGRGYITNINSSATLSDVRLQFRLLQLHLQRHPLLQRQGPLFQELGLGRP